ncbi:MAG: SGNH/GDSL hydrolase family protein [Solirubrobacteraceae bacterium]|nr:SGNH/GDSL hydrolase family protein [Solirubrobacteraceae bacterium]
MNVPSLRSLALLAGSVLSFGLGATSAQAKTLNVVVLGDSYASGVGAPGATGTCMRSPQAWGPVYAQAMRDRGFTVNFNSVACGGAVVGDLDKQIAAVTPETDLVLLTIGGNDVGFIQIVLQCFVPGISDPARCKSQIASAVKNVPGVQTKVMSRIDTLLAKLRPGAKFGVLSYPYLANTSGFVLKGFLNQYEAGTPTRALGDLGDKIITDTAATVNAKAGYQLANYIPTKDLFVGHEPDQNPSKGNPNGWINEDTNAGGLFGLYHPNAAGYQALAQAILRAGGPQGDFGVSR